MWRISAAPDAYDPSPCSDYPENKSSESSFLLATSILVNGVFGVFFNWILSKIWISFAEELTCELSKSLKSSITIDLAYKR